MAKVHFTTQNTETINPLLLKGVCGAKTTFTAELLVTTNRDHADCARCAAVADKAIAAAAKVAEKQAKRSAELAKATARAAAQMAK